MEHKVTAEPERGDRDYSPLRLPIAMLTFLLWSGFMFFSAKDIPGFDGLFETFLAMVSVVLISFMRSSAFRESKWLLPLVLCVAWVLGTSLGYRMSPKPAEIVPPEIHAPITIHGVQLGMTEEQVQELLSNPSSESGPVKVYSDTKVEYRDGRAIAIEGSVLELEGKEALLKGDPKSKIRLKFDPTKAHDSIRLEYGLGSTVIRFNTSEGQVSQIVLYEKGLEEIVLRPAELSID
jgi:hypothetical protein